MSRITKKLCYFYGALLLFVAQILVPQTTKAFTFTKNNIITDTEFSVNILSQSGIESFLQDQGSALAGYKVTDTDGTTRLVSQLIYRVAEKYNINAQVLLVMTEKESSGITSGTLSTAMRDWTLGFGVCDSCSKEDAAPYKGIALQYNWAAKRLRDYVTELETTGSTISGWQVGVSKNTLDGISVTPENAATAALYTYNPWVGAYGGGDSRWGANSLFQKLWTNWFAYSGRIQYPNGTLFRVDHTNDYYIIQYNHIHKFKSKNILSINYNPDDAITISAQVAADQERYYDVGSQIQFPNFAIVRNTKTHALYMIVDGTKRRFTKKVFHQYGYFPEEVIDVKPKDLDMPDGSPINRYLTYPGGAVLRNATNGNMFYVDAQHQKKHKIIDPSIITNRFADERVLNATRRALKELASGAPTKLRNGSLVTSANSSSVWLIDQGTRRAIASRKVFQAYNYQWKDIQRVPDDVLRLHKIGDPITLKKKTLTDQGSVTVTATAADRTTTMTTSVDIPTTQPSLIAEPLSVSVERHQQSSQSTHLLKSIKSQDHHDR